MDGLCATSSSATAFPWTAVPTPAPPPTRAPSWASLLRALAPILNTTTQEAFVQACYEHSANIIPLVFGFVGSDPPEGDATAELRTLLDAYGGQRWADAVGQDSRNRALIQRVQRRLIEHAAAGIDLRPHAATFLEVFRLLLVGMVAMMCAVALATGHATGNDASREIVISLIEVASKEAFIALRAVDIEITEAQEDDGPLLPWPMDETTRAMVDYFASTSDASGPGLRTRNSGATSASVSTVCGPISASSVRIVIRWWSAQPSPLGLARARCGR